MWRYWTELMITRFLSYFFFLGLGLVHPAFAEKAESKKESSTVATTPVKVATPVIKNGKITIAGKIVEYTATTGKMLLHDDDGKATASIFYTSYTRSGIANTSTRPVMFAFNGGPGSSSVWLHIGLLGPRRIDFPGDGTVPVEPPVRLVDNNQSVLDVCDLVFIDPVSTGYSRVEKDTKAADFHGLDADIESVGDFIRRWITENNRWNSPKYICGESYGGIRAAGLADHLQSRFGMNLNGVILLSSLLDYRTLLPAQGSQLSHQIFLPAFATTALFHGKIQGDRDAIIEESREFAFGEYAVALLKGNEIGDEEKQVVAEKLASLTGISAEIWSRHQLVMDPFEFRAELLREEKKVLGRFDSRVAWDATSPNSQSAEYDPSYSLAIGAFSTAMLAYLGDELGWKEDQPYEILTSKVNPWSYGSDNKIVNLTNRLARAIRHNPKLRVLVMGAYADLATPPDGVPYSIRQIVDLPPSLKNQISYTFYDGGHMFYMNPPDLEKAREDLIQFLTPPAR